MTTPEQPTLSPVELAAQAIQQAQAPNPSKRLRPAVVVVHIDWEDSTTGEEKRASLPVRVLNFDEDVRVSLLCSKLALGMYDSLPFDDAYFIRALATCYIMWPDMVKELREVLHEDKELTTGIFDLIVEHRNARFHGDGSEGGVRKAKIRLDVDPGSTTKAPPGV